jgi:hypothetical protein
MKRKKRILLVEPEFPFPNKSKNKANKVHKNFVPIGLLKLGALHQSKGHKVKLVRGKKNKSEIKFEPDEILVTSLFTYWSNHVWDAIEYYHNLFPDAVIHLGGIYATLHKDKPSFKENAKKYDVQVHTGVNIEAEKFFPNYKLIKGIDYHATHMMRGCIRRCAFCGTWKIEPERTNKSKEEITTELQTIGSNRVIFYDNNLLANPNIKEILTSFQTLKVNNKPVLFESQSGFDGRLLQSTPELASLIKKARFQNVRIAWDNSINDKDAIKKQIDILVEAGYTPKDLSIFMIYNFDILYEDMIKKLDYCKKWGVQITDCRYRPLDLDYDNYNPHLRNGQEEGSYYIHSKAEWTDKKIRDFRAKVRKHNIWIRYARDKGLQYDPKMEKWSSIHNLYKSFSLGKPPKMNAIEQSPLLQKRIERLRRLRAFLEKINVALPDLGQYSNQELDHKLKNLFEGKNKKQAVDKTTIRMMIPNVKFDSSELIA